MPPKPPLLFGSSRLKRFKYHDAPTKFAQNAAKDPTKVQEKAQTKPETVQALQQALVKVCTETGPGPPQTPPTAQNETKPDKNFTKLQENLRIDGELYYEKIDTIWTLCKFGKKKRQIDGEIKKAYGESELKLIKKVTEAYERSGGSEQALQELLKNLPIPAKFAQKASKDSTKPQDSTQSIAQNPPKVDAKALQNLDEKLQDPNLNTNQPPRALIQTLERTLMQCLVKVLHEVFRLHATLSKGLGITISGVFFNHIDSATHACSISTTHRLGNKTMRHYSILDQTCRITPPKGRVKVVPWTIHPELRSVRLFKPPPFS